MKTTNSFIALLERFISFILNLIWLPSFISPPNDTPVDFITKDWYVLSGTYKDGVYNYYPAEYETVKGWRYRGTISLPRFSSSSSNPFKDVTFLFSPASDHVWEWVDGAGKKHHVTKQTRDYMKENPFGSTLADKRKKMNEKKEQAVEQRVKQIENYKGNSL